MKNVVLCCDGTANEFSEDPTNVVKLSHEVGVIAEWIESRRGPEGDHVILGDMNIEDCEELATVLPANYASLNGECLPTNTMSIHPNLMTTSCITRKLRHRRSMLIAE